MTKKLKNQFLCSRMMLPEHVAALNKHNKEMKEKELFNIPEYDEQQLKLWEALLKSSMLEGLEVEINYLSSAGPVLISGIVLGMNLLRKTIRIKSKETSKNIFLKNILGVKEV